MTIKISTKSPQIPVEIDDLKFSVEATDQKLENYRKSLLELKEKLDNIRDDNEESLKLVNEGILAAFDIILGEGAGQKIYEKVGSTLVCINILNQLKEGLEKEFAERGLSTSQHDKAQQYLAAKKQRRNKNNHRK